MNLRALFSDFRFLALAVFLAGCTWLGLEFILRGHMSDILSYSFDPRLVIVLSIGTLLAGLAIRPRVSLHGEALVGGQIVGVTFLAIFSMPAAMLVLYAVTTIVSVGIAGAAWLWWLVVLLGAVVVTLLLWALMLVAVLGSLATAGETGWFALVLALLAGALVSGIGEWLADSFGARENALSFSLVETASEWTHWIPNGDELILALRGALAPIDHNLVISTIFSAAGGLLSGLLAALIARRTRQWMMRRTDWRGLLPIAAAPLPDGTPWLENELKLPAAVFLFAATFAMLWYTIF